MTNKVQVVCHKGANKLAPENTMAAARICAEWGVDYIEVDVHTSADGVFVLFHGPYLQRTTNGSGWVGALTVAELEQLDAGSWFGPQYAGERIPRLEDFLNWVKGKAKVFLDVKNADPCRLADLLRAAGMEQECFFWSGDPNWMQRMHELEPGLALKVNVQTPEQARQAHAELGARLVEVAPEQVTPELLETCHGLGMQVMALYLGNDRAVIRQVLASGADLINTDYGNLVLEELRNL